MHIETIITIEALASKIEEIAAAVPAQQAFVADLKGEVNRAAADLELAELAGNPKRIAIARTRLQCRGNWEVS